MSYELFFSMNEYGAAGMYKEPNRSLFYRKSLGIRMYYENCELYEYNNELLYPSGVKGTNMSVYPNYLDGMYLNYSELSKKNKDLADLIKKEFNIYEPSVPKEHAVSGNMYTHSFPHYERILKEGLILYIDRINEIKDQDMKEGLLNVIEGIRCYIDRIVKYLESVGAKRELIEGLKRVPLYPATNIYEAILSWNFILYLDGCDNLGCLDSGLLPYYKGENIVPLLENLYDNLDKNNGYSMSLSIDYNDLTLQCLEASKGKRRPMIQLFIDEKTPDYIWNKAFEVIRTFNGQPAFYNNDVIMNGLKEKFPFIKECDLKKFCGGGCTETMLAGLSNVGSVDAAINLLLILENTIDNKLETSKTFEEFYDNYLFAVKEVIDIVTNEISNSQLKRAKYNPLPMRTLLVDDCIDNGLDFNNGGARYKWSIISFAGVINVIDSLLVIKDYIYDNKKCSSLEFKNYLNNSDEEFLKNARNVSQRFGIDDEYSNQLTNRLSKEIFSLLDNKKPPLGEGYLASSIQFNSQAEAGRNLKASPDGRKKGAPLCDSLGAIFGKDDLGPTALLNSVTHLELKKALGTPVFNFNITPDFKNEILKALILGYLKLGGVQMQITCSSLENLLDAYKNPELHKNLVVRVGGYSEYFINLTDDLKRMVINRTIQQMG